MSYAISVPTPFNDISELAESFYSRVDEERLMLPNPDEIPEGEWVDFSVTLADGSAALAGQGRCTGSFDNGEERAAEHRFDVVIDSLQLDEMAQIYFERILLVRASYAGDEPQTGEVSVPEEAQVELAEAAPEPAEEPAEVYAEDAVADYAEPSEAYAEPSEAYAEQPIIADEYAEAPAEVFEPAAEAVEYEAAPVYEEAPVEAAYAEEPPAEEIAAEPLVAEAAEADWEQSDATELGSIEEYQSVEQPVLETPEESKIYELPPPVAPGALPSPHAVSEVLTRPFLHATWSPEPQPRPDPSPASGYFQYAVGAGLPQPAEPPRPQLDPSFRIARAPRPGDPHAPAFAAEPDGEEAYAQDAYAQDAYAQDAAEAEELPVAGHYAEGEEAGYAEESAYAAEAEPEYAEPEYAEAPEGYAEPEAHPEEAYAEAEADVAGDPNHAHEAPADEAYPSEAEHAEAAPADDGTLDVEGFDEYDLGEANQDETRQVDLSGLPGDADPGDDLADDRYAGLATELEQNLGDETLQVEIPEED